MNIKVAVALPDQTFSRAGGLRTQFERTTQELERLGCEIVFFTGNNFDELKSVDLCHVFSMNSPTFFKGHALKALNKPLVYSSVMWRESRPSTIRAFLRVAKLIPFQFLNDVVACRDLGEVSDLILPNTQQERDWLNRAIGLPCEKMLVVPNGADNRFSNVDLDSVSLPLPFEDFVFVSCVVYQRKNLVRLARACLENEYPLVIAGPVEDDSIYRSIMAEQSRGLKVVFLGALLNDDPLLGALYKKCRVFALPSYYETPGISALEAGLQGSNIVVTKVGGANEYFGSYARYVDPYEQSDITKKLHAAWNNPLSQDEKYEMSTYIASEFSWKAVAKKTLSAYREILDA